MHYPPPYTPHDNITPSGAAPELSVTLATDPTTNEVLISLVPPKEPASVSESNVSHKRSPVDICCVIDVSGSMDSELSASLVEGQAAERTGLSTLDVVKHAVRTIMETTLPDDRISIVSFSNRAEVIAGLTPMTPAGKAQVWRAVQKLQSLDSTNLWEGLKFGMNVLNGLHEAANPPSYPKSTAVTSSRFSALFLLTDGMPNINPPRGIIQMLKTYIDSHPLSFSLHTFGFGYSLDSQLLLQIARLGGGAFGFIPDASTLGAVFIHAVANLYSTFADQVEINIEYLANGESGGKAELEVPGGQSSTSCSWGSKIAAGVVQYGQTRDFVVRMKNCRPLVETSSDPILSVTVQYCPWTHHSGEAYPTVTTFLNRESITTSDSTEALIGLKHHLCRMSFIGVIDNLFGSGPAPSEASARTTNSSSFRSRQSTQTTDQLSRDMAACEFRAVLSLLKSPPLSSHTSATALAQDITGEVLLALSTYDVYTRWGQHYLPCLARCHLLQQCGSFRDPGLQVYGAESPLFLRFRDALDQAFDSLPPPEPTVKHNASRAIGRQNAVLNQHLALPQNQYHGRMSVAFASRSGPCFDGACEIALASGQNIPVRSLRRGMRVQTPKGAREIAAVLKTHLETQHTLLCELPGGLKITPWHPIKVCTGTSKNWVFPASQNIPRLQACDAVYSLLLEPDGNPDAHGVFIQGILCVTLGHGLIDEHRTGADVRGHEFLGNYTRVAHSLSAFPATNEGIFHIKGVLRYGVKGNIRGFLPYYEPRLDTSVEYPFNNGILVI